MAQCILMAQLIFVDDVEGQLQPELQRISHPQRISVQRTCTDKTGRWSCHGYSPVKPWRTTTCTDNWTLELQNWIVTCKALAHDDMYR